MVGHLVLASIDAFLARDVAPYVHVLEHDDVYPEGLLPVCGNQAIRVTARGDSGHYVVNGTKTWISNGIYGSCFALLVKPDLYAEPRHRGMSMLLAEKGSGFTVGRKLEKLGYKGIDSAELLFDDYRVPVDRLIGGVEGRGSQQTC